MKNKILLKASIDGVVQFFLFCLLIFLPALVNVSIKLRVLVSTFAALLIAFPYMLCLINEKSNKSIVLFSLWSTCSYVSCFVILFVVAIAFSIDFYPTRELSNADGLLIIFTGAIYNLLSGAIRLCIFCALLIKNTHQTKK